MYTKIPYYAPRVRARQTNPVDHPHRFSPYRVPAVRVESPAPAPFVRLTGPGMIGMGSHMPVPTDVGTHPSSSTTSRRRDRADTVVASSSKASRG